MTYNKGFTIIEILTAIAILGMIMTGFFAFFNFSLQADRQNKKSIEALNLAKENLEIIRALRDESWNNLANLNMGADYYLAKDSNNHWVLASGVENIGNFIRNARVEDVMRDANDNIVASGGINDPDTKKIISTVSWSGQNITLTAYLTNWK